MRYGINNRNLFEVTAEELAPWLIGKILCHKIEENGYKFVIRCRICVTEAYRENDSVTDANREIDPTAQMLSGGHIHFYSKKGEGRQRLDIVANVSGKAESVLISGLDPYKEGSQISVWALYANKDCDALYLLDENADYWLEDDGAIITLNEPTKRRNVTDETPLRFSLKSIEFNK